jgi:hypothetical protein
MNASIFSARALTLRAGSFRRKRDASNFSARL